MQSESSPPIKHKSKLCRPSNGSRAVQLGTLSTFFFFCVSLFSRHRHSDRESFCGLHTKRAQTVNMAMSLTFRSAMVGAMPSAKLLQAKSTTRVSATVKVRMCGKCTEDNIHRRVVQSCFNNMRESDEYTRACVRWAQVRECLREKMPLVDVSSRLSSSWSGRKKSETGDGDVAGYSSFSFIISYDTSNHRNFFRPSFSLKFFFFFFFIPMMSSLSLGVQYMRNPCADVNSVHDVLP